MAMQNIIRDVTPDEDVNAYVVDLSVLQEGNAEIAETYGLPDEEAVDKVLTHVDVYDLHMKIDSPDPIRSVQIGEHKALRSTGTLERRMLASARMR